jgi:hypothetical protein
VETRQLSTRRAKIDRIGLWGSTINMRAMAGWEAGFKLFKTPVGFSSNLKIQSSAQNRKLRHPKRTDYISRFRLVCFIS